MSEQEPAIIVILRADHKDGMHSTPNKYCPQCKEDQIASEVEDYLREQAGE